MQCRASDQRGCVRWDQLGKVGLKVDEHWGIADEDSAEQYPKQIFQIGKLQLLPENMSDTLKWKTGADMIREYQVFTKTLAKFIQKLQAGIA